MRAEIGIVLAAFAVVETLWRVAAAALALELMP
jgi:hypothetical protein